jgi:hypothetical protein
MNSIQPKVVAPIIDLSSTVLDSPVYNSSCKLPAALHGVLVWKDFKYSVNLKTIVRQGIKEQELNHF